MRSPDGRQMSLHEGNTYATLVRVAGNALEEADRIILAALHAAAPELSEFSTRVLFDVPRAEAAFETILSSVEYELLCLCRSRGFAVRPACR